MNRQERRRAERLAAKSAAGARRGGPPLPTALEQAHALIESGRSPDAEQILRAIVDADAANVPALVALSRALRLQQRLDESVATARRAAVRDGRSAAAQTALAEALRAQDRVYEAMPCHRRAIALAPEDAESRHAYGLSLLEIGDLSASVEQLRLATRFNPTSARYANSVAIALVSVGAYDEALPLFDRALTADPEQPQIRFNRAFCLLGSGRLADGWADYEYGFAARRRKPDRAFPVPQWDGTPLEPNQRLLLWREQGIGDEIRFASCYPDAMARSANVVIETDPRLVGLFRRSFPTAAVRTPTDGPDAPALSADFAAHVPAGSLPGLFRRRLEDFPSTNAYLVADPRRRDEFRRRLDALGPQPKVGICWRSMRLDVKRLLGYTTLEEWAPIFAVPGVTFVNLQYGSPTLLESELAEHEARTSVHIHRFDDVDYTNDQEAMAALIAALDLVVSVNTAVSAMAGGLGMPVVQVGLKRDVFHFGLPDRYPWFPTLQPMNRSLDESWQPTMERVAGVVAQVATDG